MPNFTNTPCVETLIFRGCVNILVVDESIEHLTELKILSLKDCRNLESLSKNFNKLESLEEIDLSGCSNLDELPRKMGKFKFLKVFYAWGAAINHNLPAFTSKETPFKRLLSTNFSLACLPSSLVDLDLENCNLFEDAFPSDFSMFGSLKILNISGNRFCSLPESIASLPMLKSLTLDYCTEIQSIEKLPVNLEWLSTVGCSSLDEIQGIYKIYPINRIDKGIAERLGLSNLESLANIKVDMLNECTRIKKTSSSLIQALEEDGVVNIFVPIDNIPKCFSLQSTGTGGRICFDVLIDDGHKKIYGMNICISYKVSHTVLRNVIHDAFLKERHEDDACFDYDIALAISHWRVGDQLEVGDRASILALTNHGFHINKCGVELVYEQDEQNWELHWEQTPLDSRWSQRKGTLGRTSGGVKRCKF
ncbi:hypothetical protein ACFE04_015271 [Oxalis oulophora]